MKAKPHVIRTKNFVTDAADFILKQAHKAIGERNEFRIALSGGNTPRPVYERIAATAHDLPWDLIRITFGDERCVPPDDPESNFRMAWETLLSPAAVTEKPILRMRLIRKSRRKSTTTSSISWPDNTANQFIDTT